MNKSSVAPRITNPCEENHLQTPKEQTQVESLINGEDINPSEGSTTHHNPESQIRQFTNSKQDDSSESSLEEHKLPRDHRAHEEASLPSERSNPIYDLRDSTQHPWSQPSSYSATFSEIRDHIAPQYQRDNWVRALTYQPQDSRTTPVKMCKDGYCRDKKKRGLAEAMALDTRQGRMRKIRKMRGDQVIVNDRYVFACCNGCKDHLTQIRRYKGVESKRTADHIQTVNLHLIREEDEQQLNEIISRLNWKAATMRRVRDTARRCAVGQSHEDQRPTVLPPLEIWTNRKKQDGALEEWLSLTNDDIRLGYIEPLNENSYVLLPMLVESSKWVLLALQTLNGKRLAKIMAPGVYQGRDAPVIQRGVISALGLAFKQDTLQEQIKAVDIWREYQSTDDKYDTLDNSIVTALLIWQMQVKGKNLYNIQEDRHYLEIQRERIYLAVELGHELEPILALECMEEQPETINPPKGYVWQGAYHARWSNRPDTYTGKDGAAGAAAPYKKKRLH